MKLSNEDFLKLSVMKDEGKNLYCEQHFDLCSTQEAYDDNNKVEWIVDGVIPRGSYMLIASPPGFGKSTLMRTIACHIAAGKDVFGAKAQRSQVIYLGYEDKKSYIRKSTASLNIDVGNNIYWHTNPSKGNSLQALELLIKDISPDIVFIDTFAEIFPATDLNSYSSMMITKEFTRITRTYDVTLCVLHHSSKGDSSNVNAILGSTAIAGKADEVLLLCQMEDVKKTRFIKTVKRRDSLDLFYTLDWDSKKEVYLL